MRPARSSIAPVLAAFAALATSLAVGANTAFADYPLLCNLAFVEQTDAAFRQLARLEFRMIYPATALSFGTGAVPCEVHPLQTGVAGTFTLEQEDDVSALHVELERANGLFPYPLASCAPHGAIDWETASLTIELLDARNANGDSLEPPPEVAVDSFDCVEPPTTTIPTSASTTTTTVDSTTTTTLAQDVLCGDADDNGSLSASDALLALRTAVGGGECPALRCDTNADTFINTSDALRILRAAVGLIEPPLVCP